MGIVIARKTALAILGLTALTVACSHPGQAAPTETQSLTVASSASANPTLRAVPWQIMKLRQRDRGLVVRFRTNQCRPLDHAAVKEPRGKTVVTLYEKRKTGCTGSPAPRQVTVSLPRPLIACHRLLIDGSTGSPPRRAPNAPKGKMTNCPRT